MNLLVLNIIKYHIHCQLQQCLNLHIIALCVGWLFLQIERFVNKYKRILPRVLGGPFPVQIPRLSQNPFQLKLLKALHWQVGFHPSICSQYLQKILPVLGLFAMCLKCRERLTRENTEFEAQLMFVSDAVMAFAHAVRDLHR